MFNEQEEEGGKLEGRGVEIRVLPANVWLKIVHFNHEQIELFPTNSLTRTFKCNSSSTYRYA